MAAKIIPFPNINPRTVTAKLDTANDLPVHIDLIVSGRVALEIVKLLEREKTQ